MAEVEKNKLVHWVDEQENELFQRWENMVNIDTGTYCKEGIDKMGGLLKEVLEKAGFEAEVYPQADYGNHLVLRKKGNGKGKILLVGHLDTVFADQEAQKRPFKIEGDRAYGPGVHDMKGGLVVMTGAVEALNALHFEDYESISVLLNSDEEVGSPSSRDLIEEEAKKADVVLVFEPARTDRSLVTARKGVGMYAIEVTGRAAHAGADPQAGVSAVEELAHKILDLHALNNYKIGTTVNAGVISGGTRSNVIAEKAKAEIDVRIFTKDEGDRIDQALQAIAGKNYLEGAETKLTGGLNRPPMEKNEGTVRLLSLVEKAGEELGIKITDVASGGASDGNFTSAVGTPTIDSMGTVGGLAHGVSEYSEIDSLLEKVKLTALTIANIKKIL